MVMLFKLALSRQIEKVSPFTQPLKPAIIMSAFIQAMYPWSLASTCASCLSKAHVTLSWSRQWTGSLANSPGTSSTFWPGCRRGMMTPCTYSHCRSSSVVPFVLSASEVLSTSATRHSHTQTQRRWQGLRLS